MTFLLYSVLELKKSCMMIVIDTLIFCGSVVGDDFWCFHDILTYKTEHSFGRDFR